MPNVKLTYVHRNQFLLLHIPVRVIYDLLIDDTVSVACYCHRIYLCAYLLSARTREALKFSDTYWRRRRRGRYWRRIVLRIRARRMCFLWISVFVQSFTVRFFMSDDISPVIDRLEYTERLLSDEETQLLTYYKENYITDKYRKRYASYQCAMHIKHLKQIKINNECIT